MILIDKFHSFKNGLLKSHVTAYQFFTLSRFAGFFLVGILLAKSGIGLKTIGHYETLMFFSGAISFFWVAGILNSMLVSYVPVTGKKDSFLFTVFILLSIISLLVFIITRSFSSSFANLLSADNHLPYFNLFGLFILLNNPTFLIEYLFLVFKNEKALQRYAIINFILQVIAVILPVYLFHSLFYSIIALIIFSAIKIFYLFILLLKYSSLKIDFRLLGEHLKFSLPLILSLLASGAGDYIDGFLVTHFFGTESFAIFRYGAKEFPLSLLLANSLSTAMIPAMIGKTNISGGLNELKKRSVNLMHLLFPVTILLLVFSKWLYPILLNDQFRESIPIFNIYLLLIISRLVFPQTVLLSKRQNHIILYTSIAEIIINVTSSLILLSYFGIIGIAWGTLISFFAEKLILAVICKRKFNIPVSDYLEVKPYLIYSLSLLILFFLVF